MSRNEFIESYLPYVKTIAGRIATHLPPTIETEDLAQVGAIGLIQAIEKYDPTRDNKFMTYAIFRIKGAILSELRSRDFIGRTTRKKIRNIEKAHIKLEQKLGENLTDEDIAREMNISLDELDKIKRVSAISNISFEEVCYGINSEKNLIEVGDKTHKMPTTLEELCIIKETKARIAYHTENLPEKERLVVSMYYSDELTMKEIGTILGITESRVSQLHSQAVIRLRGRLRKEENIIRSRYNKYSTGEKEKTLVQTLTKKIDKNYLTAKEICEMGGMSVATFYNRIKSQDIPKEGQRYLVDYCTCDTIFKPRKRGAKTKMPIKTRDERYLTAKEICEMGGIKNKQVFYRKIKGYDIPKQGTKYLLDYCTCDIFFKPRKRGPKPRSQKTIQGN